ncbi:uncharacterized protein LOC131431327 isoform X2 [Malaya genurostris]|uniref:uncharacterized protein LOC131431327 isoform X2 n=1 Tax=Malaya genurostris TaxID=325434 RepID=UPI0026F3C882|nr:uncharacterized protein LOC131431327 isoform X2 [Malaya genurostris]
MRNVWIVVASALLAFANFVKSQETSRTLYSSRYDNLDIDTILSSNRLVNNYVDCLLSRKPCPPEGKDLKRILPEALRTKCGRCSATQKENAIKIITTLYNNYPTQYQALRERWDPSGEYHRRLEEYIRGLQFNQIGSNGGNGVSPSDRPVRNDFDRDQSQILLQTLLLSTTTAAPTTPSPNVIPSGPQQRPQLAQSQITQPVAPVSITSTTTSTTSTTSTTVTPPSTTIFTSTITTTTPTTTSTTTTTTLPNTVGSGTTSSSRSSSASNGGFSVESSTAAATTSTTGTIATSSTQPPTLADSPAMDSLPTVGTVSNRFGDDGENGNGGNVPNVARPTIPNPTTARPQPAPTTKPTVRQTTTTRTVTQRTTTRFGGVPANPKGSAFVGLFNQIGTKLATTADAIAGMLRKTVDVIVTSHLQAHQRAMRSY